MTGTGNVKNSLQQSQNNRISEDFVKTNATRIGEFIFAGGAEVIATYLKQQPSKKEEIRRLVVAELLGKFEKLKYPAGDLSREIDFIIYIFPSPKIT